MEAASLPRGARLHPGHQRMPWLQQSVPQTHSCPVRNCSPAFFEAKTALTQREYPIPPLPFLLSAVQSQMYLQPSCSRRDAPGAPAAPRCEGIRPLPQDESVGYFTLLAKRCLGCGAMKINLPLQSSPPREARSPWLS